MIIPFSFPTHFGPDSDPAENAEILRALVESLITYDLIYLKYHPNTPLLTSPEFGVRYARTKDWLDIPGLFVRHYGDCKSLAAMRVAEIRFRSNGTRVAKPVFRFQYNRTGGIDYHILVQVGINEFQDPSKECGMGANEWSYFGPRAHC